MSFVNIVSLIAAGIGFVTVIWLAWFSLRADDTGAREESAREFFDVHGRWPDEG